MKTYKQTPAQGSAGFSLVELTIVVVILGVLSMMAVPRYQTAVERAKAAEAFTYLSQIEGAQERRWVSLLYGFIDKARDGSRRHGTCPGYSGYRLVPPQRSD